MCHSEMSKWKSQTGLGDVNDFMHRKRARRILEDLKKVSWIEFCVGRRRLTFPSSPRPGFGCHTCWGWVDRWKSQHRKIVYLSPYVEKPFNSKLIKSFVPELISYQVFFVFRDSYGLCYIWTFYEHYMYVSYIHIMGMLHSHFISSDKTDFQMIENLSQEFHCFIRCMLSSLSVDEMLPPGYVNWSTNFRGLPIIVEMDPLSLKHGSLVLLILS